MPRSGTRRTRSRGRGRSSRDSGSACGWDVEYVLFERAEPIGRSSREPQRPPTPTPRPPAGSRANGVRIDPASLAETAVARPFPEATLDHIAFAADDPGPVVAALRVKPFLVNDDRARFRLASGLVVEIVRDTDRPDAYWCPMHPGVRSPGRGKCPLCAMALVPIAPPRIGEYKVDVALLPRSRRRCVRPRGRRPRSGHRRSGDELHRRPRTPASSLHHQPRSRPVRARAPRAETGRRLRVAARSGRRGVRADCGLSAGRRDVATRPARRRDAGLHGPALRALPRSSRRPRPSRWPAAFASGWMRPRRYRAARPACGSMCPTRRRVCPSPISSPTWARRDTC